MVRYEYFSIFEPNYKYILRLLESDSDNHNIIKNEIFNNFYWLIYKNSYFTKNELLLTPNKMKMQLLLI